MFLTICTPTYNRAHTLHRVYESLLTQSRKAFEWIIIDDGSTDNTLDLVNTWIKEDMIEIKYYYQANQGKHIALNKGISMSSGEVFTCLDSDDWFYTNTVERVMDTWSNIRKKENIAGLIGLDTYKDKTIVGTEFPLNLEENNWVNLIYTHKVKGDKAYFFKTNVLKKYDFPNYKNNKHMPPSYQLYMLSEKYDMWLLNEPLKFIEYLEDGITNNIWEKYIVAPDNYAKYRADIMDIIPSFKRRIINAIHFNSSVLFTERKHIIKGLNNKLLVLLTKPFGYFLYKHLLNKAERKRSVERQRKI